MKERPILMSAPMVRAILNGTKTQTRRVVKPQPQFMELGGGPAFLLPRQKQWERYGYVTFDRAAQACSPYGQPGDRLWCKETWCTPECWDNVKPTDLDPAKVPIDYAADFERDTIILGRLRPSIFMRRWMSRITIEVVSVRVERLQDISEEEAEAEGVEESLGTPQVECDGQVLHYPDASFVRSYRKLWDQINGPGAWELNPWVWVVEFRRIHPVSKS